MSAREPAYFELSDEAGARIARRLRLHAAELGFFSYALLAREEWLAVLSEHGAAQEEGGSGRATAQETRSAATERLRSRYGLESAGAMLVVALRYAPDVEPTSEISGAPSALGAQKARHALPRLPEPVPGRPVARIGRFARGNWYREILDRLAVCASETARDMVAEGFPRAPSNRWRRFANSRFPERSLAIAAGLGTQGRNSILIAERTDGCPPGGSLAGAAAPRWSSAVLLGLLLLPFDLSSAACGPRRQPRAGLELCASCHRCVDACPTEALSDVSGTAVDIELAGAAAKASPPIGAPSFARERCIQHYSSVDVPLPDFLQSAWSDQLYGCDRCLEACPHFLPDSLAAVRRGRIGGAFDAAALAQLESSAIHAALTTSALDQRWISVAALRRNASIIASRDPTKSAKRGADARS